MAGQIWIIERGDDMNRYSRSVKRVAAQPSHPYELRIVDSAGIKTIPFDNLDTLKNKYSLEFLRRDDVAVVDMFASKPVLL